MRTKSSILEGYKYAVLLTLAFGLFFSAKIFAQPDTWTQKAPGPVSNARITFTINGKGYLGRGTAFYEYDPSTDAWTQKADFPGLNNSEIASFATSTKGYVGCGRDLFGASLNDFWEYDPSTDTWTQMANFPGGIRYSPVGFAISDKGYIGFGYDGNYLADLWEYTPATNSWTQMADLTGDGREWAFAFVIAGKAYIGGGKTSFSGTFANDFWEFDPITNNWTSRQPLPYSGRWGICAFTINSKGFVVGGNNEVVSFDDTYEYNPLTDQWTPRLNFPMDVSGEYCFSIGVKGYLAAADLWEYDPDGLPTITSFTPSSGTIGSFVQISGTNFSANQLNNTVKFNGIPAKVMFSTSTSLTVVVPNDATTGTISVTVSGDVATSASSFGIISDFGSIQFLPPVSHTVGSANGRVHETDFNGDGFKDFIVINSSSSVFVFMGDGFGGFTAQTPMSFPGLAVDLVIKDFNRDNRIDIAIPNNTTQNLNIMLGNGDGTFTAGPVYTLGFGPQRASSGDFNSDGFDDLMITMFNGFNVLFGTGAGTFINMTNYPMGNYPVEVTTADFNNDGNLDAAINNGWDTNTNIFLGSATGTFTFSQFISNPGSGMIISEDINGDNNKDLITTNAAAVTLLLGVGNGTFSAPQTIATSSPVGLFARDINGDDKLDLAVTNNAANTLSLFLNDGLANFTLRKTLSTVTGPGPFLLSDLNSDFLLDLVSCSYSQMYLTVALGVLPPTITSVVPSSGPIGTTVTITGTNFSGTPANNTVYFGAVRTAVTAATPTQLTVTVPVGTTYEPVTATVNGLIAYSVKPFITTFPSDGTLSACSFDPKFDFTTGSLPLGTSAMDFDGDGKVDVAVGNRTSRTIGVYRNTGTIGQINASTFDTPLILATPNADPYNIQSADVDGDGRIDIVVTVAGLGVISVYRNTSSAGTLSFDPYVNFTSGIDPLDAETIDIDGDGKPEIIAANRFSNSVSVYRNTTSTGSLSASSFQAKVDFAVGTEPYRVNVADLNGDRKPELVVSSSLSNIIHIFENTSTTGVINASTFATPVSLVTGSFPLGIALTDIDGDGLTDVAVVNNTPHTISVYRNLASGTITSGSFQPPVDFSVGNAPGGLIATDINGDGKVDLVSTNATANIISILTNSSTIGVINSTSFAASFPITTGNFPAGIQIADLDGDHRPELIVSNMNSNTFSVYLNGVGFPPTITSFAAAGGLAGSTVTISGTNFDPFPANNLVEFNGVAGLVSSSTSTSISVEVPALATTGNIAVTVRCKTATSGSAFTVCTTPSAPGAVGASTCGSGSVTLTASGASAGEYRWYSVSTGGTPEAGQVNATFAPVVTATTDYYVAINTGFCEGARTLATATVIPRPNQPTGSNPPPVCSGTALNLTVSGAANGDYRWYDGVTLIAGQVNSSMTIPSLTTTKTFGVTIFDGVCESIPTFILATVQTCTPPLIAQQVSAPFVSTVVRIDLMTLLSDAEGNLDLNSFEIVGSLSSGASATVVGAELVIDYTGIV
ncbi:MAG: VCBS repeat-containing protein, partial [Cyclobacteriaceae bacterium]|nr:VCBS repeat-containing protein [Cyclobacteriaceae bacterium]